VRLSLADTTRMDDWLLQVAASRTAAERNALPLADIAAAIEAPQDPSRTPIIQAVFISSENGSGEGAADWRHYDLVLEFRCCAANFTAQLHYSIALFSAETARRMATHLIRLLMGFVEQGPVPVSRIPLLDEAERAAILRGWNNTTVEIAPPLSLPERIQAMVAQRPDAPALTFGGTTLSYAELNARANQLAALLLRKGAGPGVLVGIYIERSIDMVVAVLATIKAGAAYIPLDPAYPCDRIAFMVEDGSPALVLSQAALRENLPRTTAEVVLLDGDAAVIAQESEKNFQIAYPHDAPIYVLYTSGSTGKPKGVLISHGALLNLLISVSKEPGLDPDEVLLAVTTLSFDISVLEINLPLMQGARIVLASSDEARDGAQIKRLIEEHDVTCLQATPSTWRMLLDAGWTPTPGFKVFAGGEPMTNELARRLTANESKVWNMYGPTETTIYSAIARITDPDQVIPIGKPVDNTQVYILDAHGEPVPPGVVGEFYIGGRGVALGYLNRPELTAEKFLDDPFTRSSTGPATWRVSCRMVRSSASGGPTTRSSCAASASSWARSRRFSPIIPTWPKRR
jgi:amino acid adenylation domain-containing protein